MLPTWYTYLVSATFGLIAGSFANVLVFRLPKERSVVWPASRCPKCRKAIRWYDNIPVLSYSMLLGKCRNCHKPISMRYPLIELLTALLFVAACAKHGFQIFLFFRDWPLITMLVAITFIDLEHRIIPDELSLGGLALGLLFSFFSFWSGYPTQYPSWLHAFSGAALGFGSFYFCAWLYFRLTGKVGMGGGDIKLLAMLGAFLGPSGVFTSIMISSITGSVVGIIFAVSQNKTKSGLLKTAIPYGPFLVLGGLYHYLFGSIL